MDNTQLIAMTEANELAHGIGETTPVSWAPSDDMTFEQWASIGNTLQQIDASLNWWIGDWLNYGEFRWGETYAQAVEVTGWKTQRLMNAKWVSSKIKISLRKEILSWTHHSHVATLPEDEQEQWLQAAIANGWSSGELKDAIKTSRQIPQIQNNGTAPHDDEPPFNFQVQWYTPEHERTPVDEYEQQADEYTEDASNYNWIDDEPETPEPREPDEVYTPPSNRMAVHFSSESPEHYTPDEIIDATLECLGTIDLDPCSNSHDAPNVPAATHYTENDDGLSRFWEGTVYMNPPYGNGIIDKWVGKLCESYECGDVTEAIALVPARPGAQWWVRLRNHPMCLIEGRLKFKGNENSAPFPSAVFYLGDDIGKFYHTFCDLGDIWQRIEPGMFGE